MPAERDYMAEIRRFEQDEQVAQAVALGCSLSQVVGIFFSMAGLALRLGSLGAGQGGARPRDACLCSPLFRRPATNHWQVVRDSAAQVGESSRQGDWRRSIKDLSHALSVSPQAAEVALHSWQYDHHKARADIQARLDRDARFNSEQRRLYNEFVETGASASPNRCAPALQHCVSVGNGDRCM